MLSLEFLKGLRVLIDHVSFGWGDTSNTRSLAASQFGDFFLDRWEVFILHPSTKNPGSCLAVFAFYRLMTDHVLFERAFTGYNQVFSCKQFGDFFSTDERCSFFIPPQKIPTAVKHFWINFVDWWLIMSHLNELLQVATRSSAVSSVVTTFSTDERCSFLIPPQKTLTAVKHFSFYLLIMSHLNEVIQVAARSSAVSSLVTFFSTDERCSFLIPPQKTLTVVKHF